MQPSKQNLKKTLKGIYLFKNVKALAVNALLAALSFALALAAKGIFGSGPIRITFENLPIFLSSFLFGPITGGITALCADLISCLYSAMVPLPLISFGAFVLGSLSGILYKYIFKNLKLKLNIFLSVAISHLIGSAVIKTFALYEFYGNIVFARAPIYLIITVIEAFILSLLLNNKTLMYQIRKVIK